MKPLHGLGTNLLLQQKICLSFLLEAIEQWLWWNLLRMTKMRPTVPMVLLCQSVCNCSGFGGDTEYSRLPLKRDFWNIFYFIGPMLKKWFYIYAGFMEKVENYWAVLLLSPHPLKSTNHNCNVARKPCFRAFWSYKVCCEGPETVYFSGQNPDLVS